MRHRKSGRHLTRTSAHRTAMRRNLAQSLFQHGEVTTTIPKAKDVRPFVERLITIARDGSLRSRQRVIAMLSDRAMIDGDNQEAYEAMSDATRARVLRARSGRRMRTGEVPASYNKKKVTFVAKSIVHHLFTDVAPRFADRAGGYTRIVRLGKHRIGDNSQLALLQLVGSEEQPAGGLRRATAGRRRKRAETRRAFAEGKEPSRRAKARSTESAAPPAESGEVT